MDSCGEAYRLARWRSVDERRIEWQEDTAKIEAEVSQVITDQLQLQLHLVRELKEENYRQRKLRLEWQDVFATGHEPSRANRE